MSHPNSKLSVVIAGESVEEEEKQVKYTRTEPGNRISKEDGVEEELNAWVGALLSVWKNIFTDSSMNPTINT